MEILEKLRSSKKNLFVGMAGPGTGKSHAFRTIIESDDYKGKNILILSFINKLVDDLSIEFKNFSNVKISTLHSFAKQKIGDIDLEPDLDDIISQDSFFIKGIDTNYREKFYEDNLTKEEEEFYKNRKNFYKHEKNLYSFNSVIYAIYQFFNKHESEIPKYDLILIDEVQDFNKGEYELIKQLNKKNRVLLVGDDDQSLYYFKKASPKQIRDLFTDIKNESFSLDYCYRCPEVIVNATNDLIKNAKQKGYLMDHLNKNFFYPKSDKSHQEKHKISSKFPKIDFIPSVSGDLLIYNLAKNIIENNKNNKKRTLVLVPSYLKQTIYDGLIEKGINIVEFELFAEEECNSFKHKMLVKTFETLTKRKTDNLSLRKILPLYLKNNEIESVLKQEKKIWQLLTEQIINKIEKDIEIFKKVKVGKDKLKVNELVRWSEIFALKKVLTRLVKGFKPVMKNSIEVEMTTVTSSKGLAADFVYYVGIDDRIMLDRITKNFSNQKICEFLVGITRTKEKLTLISFEDKNPKILDLIDIKYINRLENKN